MVQMEIDNENDETTPRLGENGSLLRLVAPEESGEGLPYAPVDWPNPGDVWSWRVGRRVAFNGHFLDRYLYLPRRLSRRESKNGKRRSFASKLSVERYIRSAFPDANVESFFASFSWKIPSKVSPTKGSILPSFEETTENSDSDSESDGVGCKAGNKRCSSITAQAETQTVAAMHCDICCNEPHFCRDCSCILCCKTVSSKYGGYNYIKCEALVSEGYMCGHVAHVDCALRTYMAGTVGGSIGLDVEYYCRRCDARTDLIPHVMKLLQTCESIDSYEEVEKVLTTGICILRGSQKPNAKGLMNRIESAIAKLKSGISLEDLWKVEEDVSVICTVASPDIKLEITDQQENLEKRSPDNLSVSSNYHVESLRLEIEIDRILSELRKSQESEYKVAEERLCAQKSYLQSLHQQVEEEKSELKRRKVIGTKREAMLSTVLNKIKQEVAKLKDMEQVARGFGRTSKNILKEHFGIESEE